MALIYPVAERNAILDFFAGRVNGGTTNPSARLNIFSSNAVLLVSFGLQNPAFSTAASGSLSILGVPIETTAENFGATPLVADNFSILDRDNTVKALSQPGDITVPGGGGILTIENTTIVQGQAVRLTGFTLTLSNPA